MRLDALEIVKLEFLVGHCTDVDGVFQFLQVFADMTAPTTHVSINQSIR